MKPFSDHIESFETATCSYEVKKPKDFDSNVFIQKLKTNNPSLDDLVYLKNDFALTHSLDLRGVLKSYKMTNTEEGFVIYKEYFNGIPLTDYLSKVEFSVPEFITLATNITQLLQQLHRKNLLVKEFVIENILINVKTKEVKLCSLGSASELERELVDYNSEFNYYGSLWHIAPEQTGRIGRSIDHRSDFYALGIIFYQILCGKKPFYYTDSLELIHAHIAKTPIQPKSIVSSVPDAFNEIVLKLMSKNAEERYQSDSGILYDLKKCEEEWKKKEKIDAFQLGLEDFSSTFYISEKLYGRKREIEELLKGWNEIRNELSKFYIVGGFSGIGKTRLINEIRKPVIESKGFFISGKYDQLNREVAFSAFIQTATSLVQNILSETDLQVAQWKEAIGKQTDSDIAFLCELIPELKSLVDGDLEVIDIGPVEGKKKLYKTVLEFLSIFEIMDRPVAIFLDDLQWADIASLELLQTILESDLKNILIIGAYRDNEVDQSHPLVHFIEAVEKNIPQRITKVFLKDLTNEDINQLIADSFQTSPALTLDLTEAITKKTKGNPFFVKQFLQQLVSDNIIFFNKVERHWSWDLIAIDGMMISDYAVDLLLNKMEKLSENARQAVSLAACIGSVFDFNTLATISSISRAELSDGLWELIGKDFINSIGSWGRFHFDELWKDMSTYGGVNYEFRFQHDKIQQAAYSIIPEKDQNKQHYLIGKILRAKFSDTQMSEKLFDVLNHFIIGKEYIEKEDDKLGLAKLTLRAARRAMRNNVIRPASIYFKFGMDLIEGNQEVEFFKELLIGQSECEYLLGNYDLSEALFDEAVKNAKTKLNKADILCRKMALYENTQRHALAIDTARIGLGHLGMKLPKKVTQFHVMKELLYVKFLLRNKSTTQLLNHKPMESPDKIVIMKILMNLWGPAYLLQKQELLAFKILRMVNYSVRFGNSIESALAYAFYGYVVSAQLKDYKTGIDFGQLGMDLNQKLHDKTLRSKVIVIAEGCVAHWGRAYDTMLPKLREGFHVGVESNDIIYAGYATTFMNRLHIFSGMQLQTVINKVTGFFQFVDKVNAVISRQQMLPWTRMVYDLMDQEPNPEIFKELLDPKAYFDHVNMMNDELKVQLPLASHHCAKTVYHYIMGDYDTSFEEAKLADPLMLSLMGLSEWGEQIVYKTLAGIVLMQKGRELSRKDRKAIQANLKIMSVWADHAPDNYESKYLLAKAEFSIVENQPSQAEGYFERAIASASKASMIHMSALTYERMGFFYQQQGSVDQSRQMFRKSIIDYHEWGAKKKVTQLQEMIKPPSIAQSLDQPQSIGLSSKKLDLQTILLASQTLSGEVRIDQLMDKLLLILIKNAGAQNAYLIRHFDNRFVVEASKQIENDSQLLLNATPIGDIQDIAPGIVRKAYQSRQVQIVNDVESERATNAELLGNSKAKSLLCLPIINKGELLALIYLDNHVSKQVFTEKRMQLLELLSGQIAISLENAELYQNLEERVLQRTQVIEQQKLELQKSKKQSDDLLLNILPEEIAEELKEFGSCKTRRYDSVTIMFTDYEDFTNLSEELSPEELIEIVDFQYKAFDTITEKYGIEKIKTIGDSYMCVSGLPMKADDHAINAVKAALEMSEFVASYNERRKAEGLPYSQMRIGLHSGPVIAGVVGHKKFAYDVWGDSVNTASRMESSCETGRVNISGTTYDLIRDHFDCEFRGKIKAKRKGEIEMYYVLRSK